MKPTLTLFGTEHCHLCEEAEAILKHAGLPWRYIDIAGDDTLMDDYGIRIPVLYREDTHAELGWPFTLAEAVSFAKG